jgi:hypothetical protein
MKLKKVKGTLRHDFDTDLVLKYIKENALDDSEYSRILENACQVIVSLRRRVDSMGRAGQIIAKLGEAVE